MSRSRVLGVRRRITGAALSALLLSTGGLGFVVDGSAAAQEAGPGTEVRIVARLLDSGKIEFGLQQRRADTTWGEQQLPERRLFPADAAVDRWLWSEELDLSFAVVRITARKLPDGDVEFGLQQRGADDAWGERLLPTRRFFPAEATVDEWLPSSSLDLGAPGDPEVTDPLGLVAGYEFATAYSLGPDVWEVWLCDTPEGELFSTDRDVRLNPENYADAFTQRVGPWFAWQSSGAYEPVFRGGGLVTSPEAEPAQCEEAVAGAIRSNDVNGVLIVAAQLDPDTDGILGYAGCGLRSRRSWPDSGRSAVVYAGAFGHPTVVAHELGHALCWPHSYTGSTLTDGEIGQYDNVMDQMSGARGDNPPSANDVPFPLTIGTIAFNRYAAGWIDPAEVAIHEPGTTADYELAPPGEPGTQMLVLADPETGTDGVFAVLGARVRGAGGEEWHDGNIPAEGVEFYWIDQTHEGCRLPERGACSGLDRRTVPIDAAPYRTSHVAGAGSTFWTISGHEVTVGEPTDETGAYPVTVRPIDVLAWHYTSRADSDESGQEDLGGATGEANEDEEDEAEEQEGAARTSADLISGEQDFGSKYGVVSLKRVVLGGSRRRRPVFVERLPRSRCRQGSGYGASDRRHLPVRRGVRPAASPMVGDRRRAGRQGSGGRHRRTRRRPAGAGGAVARDRAGGRRHPGRQRHIPRADRHRGNRAGAGGLRRRARRSGSRRRLDLTDRRERRPRGAAAVRGPDLLRARPAGAVPPDACEALRGVHRATTHRQRHPRRHGNLQRR